MKRSTVFLIFSAILLFACVLTQPKSSGCLPLENFLEADLVGTWVAESLRDTDTLILKEDGTYKQIIHIESRMIDYESDWQRGQIEYTEIGIPHLYLEGLRTCAYLRGSDCRQAGSDGGFWWDFCAKDSINMPADGGILIVVGVSRQFQQPLRGIRLVLPTRYTDEGAWTYELREP